VAKVLKAPEKSLEREVRYAASALFKRTKLIPSMIDHIKELLHVDDRRGDAERF
jgi:CRISPR-associated protein Cas1